MDNKLIMRKDNNYLVIEFHYNDLTSAEGFYVNKNQWDLMKQNHSCSEDNCKYKYVIYSEKKDDTLDEDYFYSKDKLNQL